MLQRLRNIGPGIVIAATGLGAGDLIAASVAGAKYGTALLWAVVIGAVMKFALNEGLARWQLATGTTLLEGVIAHFGRAAGWLFLAYLLLWSFFVGSALMSACGVALHALFPVFDEPGTGKVVFGILSSLAGIFLVLLGGYGLFEKVMKVAIALMFLVVVFTAVALWPGTGAVLEGLLVPAIPEGGLDWTLALMGGVGGTVTVLCYGYWLREENRGGQDALRTSRIDLAAAYAVTALFGVAMVIIGSTVEIEGRGAGLLVILSERLAETLGPVAGTLFLLGALGAVFSSLLGVWQAVPYLFADLWGQLLGTHGPGEAAGGSALDDAIDTRSLPYRGYPAALALLPMAGLFHSFREVQKAYAIAGAWFLPVLALALLFLNGRAGWVGPRYRSRPATQAVLLATLAFFSWIAWRSMR